MARLMKEVDEEEETFESSNESTNILCFSIGARRKDSISGKPLLHGDDPRENCWDKRCMSRTKEFVLHSMGGFKIKALVQKVRCKCNKTNSKIKNKKPIFHYDSESYALNFDEGGDDQDVGFLERMAS